MNQPCDCCSGVQVSTAQQEANRPGLPAITYRAGTYSTFFETMVARLSSLYLDVPQNPGSETLKRIYPLRDLTTRERSDPSIGLLDAWAIVADVLTFYQERIANEGYLLTATERRSVLELARLVGYKLRPGVSASVFLAFTAATGFKGSIPAGARAQSIPGAGESAQFFETSVDLTARDVWNSLQPRLTRPQVITLKADPGTDAATRETVYFQGITTNLKPGDALLFVLGDDTGRQALRLIESVDAQADQKRTEVTLQETLAVSGNTAEEIVSNALQPFIDMASSIFADSDLATKVSGILRQLISDVNTAPDDQAASEMIQAAIPQIEEEHDIAARRKFTRLEPWTADLLQVLRALVGDVQDTETGGGSSGTPVFSNVGLAASAIGNLTAIVEQLAQPPSLQPANSKRLVRTVTQAFSPQADLAPRLLATFRPAIAPVIYKAWAGVETPTSQAEVYALRVKAGLFGSNSPQQVPVPAVGQVTKPQEWPISSADSGETVTLDSSYDKIGAGSWVVVNSPDLTAPIFARATDVRTVSRADYGAAGRVTQIALDQEWMTVPNPNKDIAPLRRFTIWAQAELLDLAEEPLDTDIEGDSIELAQLYDGLESGRWIIVSGERTDIPNTTGVTASELVMIAAVTQGSRAPLCVKFPSDYTPFSQVFYTTDANAAGDQLVVGAMDAASFQTLTSQIPLPAVAGQEFCDQAQVAQGFYVNAYVPTKGERSGDFSDFEGLLVDPSTGLPYPGGKIPLPSTGAPPVFAWRISSKPIHTILTLANKLAYTYDSTSVTIYGNVVKATNGQTVGEVLGDTDATQAFQKFVLHQKPLTFVAAATPEGAQSTLVVRVNEIEWHEQNNLAALGPVDRGYITQTDDSDQTTVVFGNGEHGVRVPTGSANVKAVYRYGIGPAGNVAAGQISQLATHPLGAQGVINPLPASGGADRDGMDQARRNAPLSVVALDRLVSVRDYADFAHTFAGIGKASSARLSDGRRQLVHVTVSGVGDIPIDQNSDLYRSLVQALHQFGDPFEPIRVALRRLKVLVISARVKLLPDYLWESIETSVRAALLRAFGFDQRELGQSGFLAEVISTIQTVPGVSYVDMQTFDSVGENVTAKQLASLAATLTLRNVVTADLAQVDTTATDPAKRILPAEIAILTPNIADTLILTEITG
jgi:hypothetical protein